MNKEQFEKECLSNIKRDGIKQFLQWLSTTDFYEAPASTIYHGNYAGGLCEHSLHTYGELMYLNKVCKAGYSDETIAIVSLFHDVCKANFYSIYQRNVKNEMTGRWEVKDCYKRDERECFGGHGSKSVYLIMQYMLLTQEEASAINCHMGAWDKSDYGNPSEVFEQNKLAFLLHMADSYATYYLDRKVTQ